MDAVANFYWLVGLLEGEGSFMSPSPSRPNEPRVEIEMNDFDVIARAAKLMGTSVATRKRSRQIKGHQEVALHTTYRARLSGLRAVQLVHALKPHMSARRQQQMTRALSHYVPRTARQVTESVQPFDFAVLCETTMCSRESALGSTRCVECSNQQPPVGVA